MSEFAVGLAATWHLYVAGVLIFGVSYAVARGISWLDARWSAPSDYVAIGHRGRNEQP